MNTFDNAMDFVFRWEGGYTNNPADAGGETNFGIAKSSHPDVDIANLTKETAKAIYKEEYWAKIKGQELPPAVAIAAMDFAVNSGVPRASKMLQKIAGAKQDGKIGPKSLQAIQAISDEKGEKEVAKALIMERVTFLTGIIKRKPSQLVFLTGWMKRTHALMATVVSC